MKDIVLFVLLGLGGGAVIAGIAMAVVITYRGSGIINLATGAIAMVSAYGFWALKSGYFHVTFGTVPAAIVTMAVAILVGVLSELLVFRPLRTSSPLAKLVASLGILLILQATMLLWFGSASQSIPSVFPKDIVEVFGKSFPVNRFWMAGVVVLIAVALGALFRWTRFGLATRAASENEVFGMLAGLSPNQLSMANTVLASAVAGAMGIVAAPLAQADSTTLVFFIVPALAAALFAGFDVALDRLPRRLRRRDRPVADGVGGDAGRGSRPTAAIRSRACRRCSRSCCSCSRCRSAVPACRRAASWSRSGSRSRRDHGGSPDRLRCWRSSARCC